MNCVTAERTASIIFPSFSCRKETTSHDTDILERYIERYRKYAVAPQSQISNNRLEESIHISHPPASEWLETIQERVRNSIMPIGDEAENDGRWLTQDIADAALEFFQTTSDLLPIEPYIYSSKKGDLVAEFEDKHGNMTCIVSPEFTLLFAVIDGVSIEKRLFPTKNSLGDLRAEVQQLTKMIRIGRHGSLDTTN
jgi:hypothetical protein